VAFVYVAFVYVAFVGICGIRKMRERRVEKKGMIKWLGENGGKLVGTKKYL
jgi:hypothetical protein